jgi:acyl-CoA synthetase (AMP-forming)/AMP-acid ligase II
MSNLYAGRKMVYLPHFDAKKWVRLAATERVTNATVVPTMLDRIVTALEEQPTALPALRYLAYGGSKVGLPLVRKALDLLPLVGFVNAYGLTETSSTIAVLTPDDHRTAHRASDPVVAKRLGSVGHPVPGIEVEIRDDNGVVLGPNEMGELFVRGDQVAASARSSTTTDGSRPRIWPPLIEMGFCSSAVGPTTPSSVVVRTLRPPNSRTCSSSTPMCTTLR